MNTTLRSITASIFVCCLALASGCSGSARAKVSGVVTYKNAPLKGGNMTLSSDSGGSYSCIIQPDGTYSVTDVATGTYNVTIETESLNPDKKAPKSAVAEKGSQRESEHNKYMEAMGQGSGQNKSGAGDSGTGGASKEDLAKLYTKIPTKYASKTTSGLQIEVGSGATVKEFPLAD